VEAEMAVTNPRPERSKNFEVYAGYEASPLVTANLIEQITPVNTDLVLRWVNRVAGEGLRLSQMVYSGFELFRPDELKMKSGGKIPEMMIKDGKIFYGDLIACKISKAKYYGALKHNHNVAVASANRMRVHEEALERAAREVGRNTPNEIKAKVQFFEPTEKEIKEKIGE
jgi:hypothetical protein